MVQIIGVRFREVGKIYYFSPGNEEYKRGDWVIVETSKGMECGSVIMPNKEVEDDRVVKPLKEVTRRATFEDLELMEKFRSKEKSAYIEAKKKIAEHKMDEMKLIAAEYSFDGSKLLLYFTADDRVDFRELVKDLAATFRARIEMRQVGVRDETKIVGGIGSCGRPLCCHSYLKDFVPVTIKMAKEQSLSLNPQKISGACGRLMCCLANEVDAYKDLNERLPKKGDTAHTKEGKDGVVYDVNILRQRIKVLFTDDKGDREMEEFDAGELTYTSRKKGEPHAERIKGGIISKVSKTKERPESEEAPHETDKKQKKEGQPKAEERQVNNKPSYNGKQYPRDNHGRKNPKRPVEKSSAKELENRSENKIENKTENKNRKPFFKKKKTRKPQSNESRGKGQAD